MLQDRKITDWTQPVSSLEDRPRMAASALKAAFDSNTNQIKPAFNGAIDDLTGTSGAENIGISPISGVSGTNVQMVLAALKALIDLCDTTDGVDEKLELKADKTTTDKLVKTISFSADTGVFTIKTDDGTTTTIDTLLEKIPINCYLDGQEFVLVLEDGTEQRADLSAFLLPTEFSDSATIAFSNSDGIVSATIKNGSITLSMLESTLYASLEALKTAAQTAADNAETSEENAASYRDQANTYATSASENASEAQSHAKTSESWAIGGTGTRAGEDTNNSKYYSQQSAASAQSASTSANSAMEQADSAEASAASASQSASNAEQSKNAAAQSKSDAATSAQQSAASASAASQSASESAESKAAAASSASSASGSASAAAASEQSALESKNAASASAQAASASAASAAASQASAADSNTAAQSAAARAEQAAEDAEAIAGGDYIPNSQKGVPGGVATLDSTGKIPSSQLGDMDYDPAGSAAAVQTNLTAHTADKNNPHSVTAAQVGAIPTSQKGQPNGVAQLGEDGKLDPAQIGAAGGSLLTVTFDESFAGLPYTIAGGEESYSGTVPESLEVVQSLLGVDTAYTLTVQGSSKNYTRTVTTLDYFTALEVSIAPFAATITVTCPAGSTVTCANDGTTLTQTATSGTAVFTVGNTGTWTITATLDGESASGEVVISADGESKSITLQYVHIYGVLWDGTSTTVLSRTDDAADFTDPVPYVSGASAYSSPFDDLMPWSGMQRSTDPQAGELVAIPKFWYKWTKSGNSLKLQIADKAVDGFFVSPAHCDRGDGAGERDVVYVGRYHCHTSNYKSQSSGLPKVSITRSTARSNIHALGSNIWQWDWAIRSTIQLLYLVEFADWNCQKTIGYGCGENYGASNVGYTDSMPYHTGTTQESRTTFGIGTQYRYIEGLWDNVYDWVDGCYYDSNGLNIILNPNNFSDTSGGTAVGVPSSGFPSALTVDNALNNQWVYPTAASGSDSTYVPDGWSFSASSPCLRVGGSYDQSLGHGLFYVYYNAASNAGSYIGSRLMKLP